MAHYPSRVTKTKVLVGLGRLELPTLRLSGVRSNHLSYKPISLGLATLGLLKEDMWTV